MNRPSALADDFWLTARNQVGMTPVISSWHQGLGLGTALLAEMVMADPAWIWIKDGELFLNPTAPWHEIENSLREIMILIWEEQEVILSAEAAARGWADTSQGQHRPRPGIKAHEVLKYLAGQDPGDTGPRAQVMIEGKLNARGGYERRVVGDPQAPYHLVVEQGRLAIGNPPVAMPVQVRKGLMRKEWVHMPLSPNVTGMPTTWINRKIQRGEPLNHRDFVLIFLLHLTDISRRSDSIGVEYWPSADRCRQALPAELNHLLALAEEVKEAQVMR